MLGLWRSWPQNLQMKNSTDPEPKLVHKCWINYYYYGTWCAFIVVVLVMQHTVFINVRI